MEYGIYFFVHFIFSKILKLKNKYFRKKSFRKYEMNKKTISIFHIIYYIIHNIFY
jgi:hypothetical protein